VIRVVNGILRYVDLSASPLSGSDLGDTGI
jgi:hypothetical protein